MEENKEYRNIQELAAGVKANVDELSNGTLSLNEIEAVVNEMRELYERLVVIRHGAMQKKEKGKGKSEIGKEKKDEGKTEDLDTNSDKGPKEGVLAENAPANEGLFKLDTEKPIEIEVPKNQTSLIDQIEELGSESLNEKMADHSAGSLAEKLKGGPIKDLKSAIGLNNKFWFIKEIFNEDKNAFNKALEALDDAGDHASAQKWFDSEIRPSLKADHDETALRKFLELLERRYTANV